METAAEEGARCGAGSGAKEVEEVVKALNSTALAEVEAVATAVGAAASAGVVEGSEVKAADRLDPASDCMSSKA